MKLDPCPYCGLDVGSEPMEHATPRLCIRVLTQKLHAAEAEIERLRIDNKYFSLILKQKKCPGRINQETQ